jgi:cell division protein ZapE
MGPVAERYAALVAAGELKPDPDQERAAQAIDRFAAELGQTRTGFLSRLFGRETPALSGVYLWGGVGRGKSMLMDLAFDAIDVSPKRRTHFHAFMLEVHGRLREARKDEEGDPVLRVAADIAGELRFLAFDEMMVTNPADAMIMSRLFTALLDGGVGIVTTSNRPPSDLY